MPVPADTLMSNDSRTSFQPAPKEPTHRARSVVEIVVLAILLGGVAWAAFTEEGRKTWSQLTERIGAAVEPITQKASSGAGQDEQDATEALNRAGVVVIAEPPDRHVTSVNFTRFRDDPIDDAVLARLTSFPRLGIVNFANTGVADGQLVHLAGLSSLTSVHLGGTAITDAGLPHLRQLGDLTALHLLET